MHNHRLRDALLCKGLTPQQAAATLGVDPKTVERWITKNRTPYPKHRYQLAALVGKSASYLWPDAVTSQRAAEVATSEVVSVYPHRSLVSRELWQRLINECNCKLDILVYAGLFLTEDPALVRTLHTKAHNGAKIRLLFGDPKCREVTKRSIEENIGTGTIAAKIRNVLAFFRQLADEPGIEIRLHRTTLYNSIYRFDDEMLVNTHVYGSMAAHAPALHLRRLSGGDLFDTYSESFDLVWRDSRATTWDS